MSERKQGLPKPVDPDLLPSQTAFKTLSDEMLRYKRCKNLSSVTFRIVTDPTELLERLAQSTFQDLLLRPGESLSAPQPNKHYPDLHLVVGKTVVTNVNLTLKAWKEKKWRFDPNEPEKPSSKIINYPGVFDWMREIDIEIGFSNARNRATQILFLYDASRYAGTIPEIVRTIYAPRYGENGYEGHNRISRPFRDEAEAMFFVDLARELFEKRKTVPTAAKPSAK